MPKSKLTGPCFIHNCYKNSNNFRCLSDRAIEKATYKGNLQRYPYLQQGQQICFPHYMAIVKNPPSVKEREEREKEIIQYINLIETNIIPAFSTSFDINLSFGTFFFGYGKCTEIIHILFNGVFYLMVKRILFDEYLTACGHGIQPFDDHKIIIIDYNDSKTTNRTTTSSDVIKSSDEVLVSFQAKGLTDSFFRDCAKCRRSLGEFIGQNYKDDKITNMVENIIRTYGLEIMR
ncbi:5407_t:CDS:2 [Entrophospora sp. SA101]|nr:5407_t:CDS:2 [Entrophospora sp. SA101]